IVTLQRGTLEVENGVRISNYVLMTGGSYSRIMSGDITDAVDSNSGFGGPSTTATILAGSLSGNSTLLTKSSATSGAFNDQVRLSDVYSFTGTGTAPFVLQLTVGFVQSGNVLGWVDGTNFWKNAVTGNTGNNATAAEQGFAGSFGEFESLYGYDLSS